MLKNCLLVSLVLIGWFTGCGKEDLPTAGGDRIKTIVRYMNGYSEGTTFFSYDQQGRLVADSSFNEESGPLQNYRTFTYDGAGNVIEKKNFDAHHTFTGSEVYAYDRNPNYLQPAHYFSYGGEYALSKNNRIATPGIQGTVQHDYYSNGLPRKTTYTSGDGRSAVHEYYYE